jgi:hypothetical protein
MAVARLSGTSAPARKPKLFKGTVDEAIAAIFGGER